MDDTDTLRFRSTIEINNINPYVLVSAEDARRLKQGWRKPMPVRGRVNGAPEAWWRINMMPVGDGSFYLYLHAEVRKAAACQVGDVVDVELAFDGDYRSGPTHPMPPAFRAAARLKLGGDAQRAELADGGHRRLRRLGNVEVPADDDAGLRTDDPQHGPLPACCVRHPQPDAGLHAVESQERYLVHEAHCPPIEPIASRDET